MSKAFKELRRQAKRIRELEQEAIRRYIDSCDWASVIDMLSEEEQEEYWLMIRGEEE